MKVGDLVKQISWDGLGIVMCLDPNEIGDDDEAMVLWNDGDLCYHSHMAGLMEVISESR